MAEKLLFCHYTTITHSSLFTLHSPVVQLSVSHDCQTRQGR